MDLDIVPDLDNRRDNHERGFWTALVLRRDFGIYHRFFGEIINLTTLCLLNNNGFSLSSFFYWLVFYFWGSNNVGMRFASWKWNRGSLVRSPLVPQGKDWFYSLVPNRWWVIFWSFQEDDLWVFCWCAKGKLAREYVQGFQLLDYWLINSWFFPDSC